MSPLALPARRGLANAVVDEHILRLRDEHVNIKHLLDSNQYLIDIHIMMLLIVYGYVTSFQVSTAAARSSEYA